MATLRSAAVPVPSIRRSALRTRPSALSRDPWFDNIKMTLVTLVVVGHAWTLLPSTTDTAWAYDFLYSWHIPAFVIVTGYLSRGFSWEPAKLAALVRTVAVPYILFEAALAWFRYEIGGVALEDLFTDPHWPMWYLAALFCWRLLTPLFLALPATVALPAAVAISLVAGLRAGDTFDLARVLGLLPFFVLGLKLKRAHWDRLRSLRWAPFAGLAGLATVLVLARFTDDWIATEWYYYRSRYDVLEPDDARAMAIRAVLLGIGLLGALSCFVLVPRVRGWYTGLGAATLVVYLFHGFVVLGAKYEGYPIWAETHLALATAVTTLGALLLALALAAPPVARRLRYAVDPLGALTRVRRRRPARALS